MVSRYRFLFSLRWLGLFALAAVLVGACVWLGTWQHDRYESRATTNDRIAEAADAEPAPVAELAAAGEPLDSSHEWSMVSAEGVYDPEGEVLIRNRSVEGQTGYEVVTPLVLADGTAVLVDRGWVPPSEEGATALPDVPPPPAGTVTVTGRLRASEGTVSGFTRVDGVMQARTVSVDQIADETGLTLLPGYITETEPRDGLVAIPVVEERSWQNFAYAYQWWLFGAMIPVGLVLLARRDARTVAAQG
ncbi:cytochrome oxidase assembly protein ShyY1 [Stackebrandtia albiflava]|uniref:SURF1-like protein n=1 Tax=Stackebrandtia albiflava TaxID=406432 RepID=A0A562VAJ5_9ACTN|nr:SURF1 family protein [Stackebrandtia albiflava]TWJ14909.1 cytochrome oxidase assembly protein ShyY1 [Stackebrandtia albiflava]